MSILWSNQIKELEEKLCRVQLDNIQIRQEKSELQDEIVRLTGIISAKTENCQVGPWCDGCLYQGTSAYIGRFEDKAKHPYITNERGQLVYCKKYLSEICPEYTSPYKPTLSGVMYAAHKLEADRRKDGKDGNEK